MMRTLTLCSALLVMSVLTTPANGVGLWDRIKSASPMAAAEEPVYVDAEYMDGESAVVLTPDGIGYPDDGYGGYDSCGCCECKESKGLCTKCLDYMKGMWNRLSRRDRHCCPAPPECPCADCCDEAPCCCEPPKRTCCCLEMLRSFPWRLRLNKLWAKSDGCGACGSGETIIDDYYEVPGETVPYTIETVPPSASLEPIEDPIASAAPRAEKRRLWRLLRQTRREAVEALPEHPGV